MRISLGKYSTIIGKSFVENCSQIVCSNFATNRYGESWDSSCEKSWVPVHANTNKSHFKKQWSESYSEKASAFMLKSADS